MKDKNLLIIASAGAGKTYTMVQNALKQSLSTIKRILITTYTEENIKNIKSEFLKQNNGIIPSNIIILPWFSFLLHEFVRPFQGTMDNDLWDKSIGFNFVKNPPSAQKIGKDGKSLLIPGTKFPQTRSEETHFIRHYFTKNYEIFSDKIAKFSYKCNLKSAGKPIGRVEKIYSHIFIDEMQDLAGYDLNIIDILLNSPIYIFMVGDPRQAVFFTNHSSKNKKFKGATIQNFFESDQFNHLIEIIEIDANYRSNNIICEFANKLYPGLPQSKSVNNITTGHDGIFLVRKKDVARYLNEYQKCIQLRWDSRTQCLDGYSTLNFGLSKGCSFDRVLIYPTPKIIEWIKDNSFEIGNMIRAKLYVGITRARYSVGFVYNYQDENLEGLQKYE